MSLFAARTAQTTLPCPTCGALLHIGRSCREVQMLCSACGGQFPLKEHIARADEAMEHFLENVYLDRV